MTTGIERTGPTEKLLESLKAKGLLKEIRRAEIDLRHAKSDDERRERSDTVARLRSTLSRVRYFQKGLDAEHNPVLFRSMPL